MKDIAVKIKLVYLPFLAVSIGTILFYNLFRWTFDLKLGILPLKEDLLNFWIPFIFPWIPVLIWLRRRIRILSVKGKMDNGHFGYQFAMAAAIVAPIIVSQNYIQKASFSLISITHPSETNSYINEKYFDINSFRIDKIESLPYVTARSSGRNNEDLDYYLYLACPFENSGNVWYGVEYRRNLSNRISDERKDSEYRSFIKESEREFGIYDFQKVRYFEKLGYSDHWDGFIEAIKKKHPSVNEEKQIILVPKSDIFENRLGNTFLWIFGSFGIGAIVLFLMVVIPDIDEKELRDYREGKPLKEDVLKDVLKILDPRGPNNATAILLLPNIVVFVVMTLSGLNILSPTPQELLEIGGNRRYEVLNGEYWRLFTSIFIHGGLIHLMMNLFGLSLGAILLVGILGRTKLILSYIACGILASIASIIWHENTVSVGASGAIFGLYGLILAFTVFKIYPNQMRGITWVFLGLFAGVSLLFGVSGGIDNAAHVGGLISGFAIGCILILTNKEQLQGKGS